MKDEDFDFEDDSDDINEEDNDFEEDKSFDDDDSFMDDGFGGIDEFGGGGIAPMEKHADLLKDLTNFAPYLKDKINGWLGLIWDEEQDKYVRDPSVKPIMNTHCARWCVDYLKTYARGNNTITHINQEDYIQIQEDIIEVVWMNLGTRPEDFDLNEEGDLLAVAVELQHAAIVVLMGAGDGKYSNLFKETVNRNESVSYNQPMGGKQGGMMVEEPKKPSGFFHRVGAMLKGTN